jgi:exonuclease SbcD
VENYGRPAVQADVDVLPPFFAPGVDRRHYLGMSTRLLDFLTAFDWVVEFALTEGVDLVLFAGDAYKSRDPSQTHQREFARRVARLAEHGVTVFLLVGNHDLPNAPGRATALDIFSTLRVADTHVGDVLATHQVKTRSGPLQIVALPWIRRGALLSREEHRGKSIGELVRYVEEELTRRLIEQAEALDPEVPAVLVGHVTVAGAITSSEQSMMIGRDPVLQHSVVANCAFDYVALGHIHRHQQLGTAPPVVYAGSLQRVDFSEEKDTKGFCLVDLDAQQPRGARASWQFIPVPVRAFITIDVEIPYGEADPVGFVLRQATQHNLEEAVVRLRVRVPEALTPGLNERAIRAGLGKAYFVAPLVREVLREQRSRLGTKAHGLTLSEALKYYLDQQSDLSEEELRAALERGQELISEENAQE